jgi:signal transduction histidine kinase
LADGLAPVQGLFVNGADGHPLVNSLAHPVPRQISYADREWYQWHRIGERGAFLTEQLLSRVIGKPFFDLSRRRTLRDGSFGGVVNASLRPEYLTDFYRELDAAEMRFAVVRADGRLIARWPGEVKPGATLSAESMMMHSIAQGSAQGESDGAPPLEGPERLATWRKLGPYPAYVVTAIDRSDVMAAWYRRISLLALFFVPLAAGFAWMTLYALRQARLELEAARRLEDETRRREHVEKALMNSQRLEAMGRLAGGVAHDFNNLLMVLSNNVHLLRRLRPEVSDSAEVAAIERSIESGAKLTRQMLSFSRQQALVPQRLLLQEKIPAILDLLRPVLGSTVKLTASVAGDTRAIEVDPAELELALINLAVNAKDAMPGGGQLEISARNARPGECEGLAGDFVVIEVADSGVGMNAATVARGFEPFFTTKPVGYGTGLGLSQVQGLCQGAGGRAQIDSRPGAGTRIRLYFPQRGRVADIAAPIPAGDISPIPCQLLLVEDNDQVAEGTRDVLRSLGCRVDHVSDAAAALSRLETGNFDAVLSDIEMPGGLDGIGLAAKLAQSHPQLPVVLMTGYASRLEQAVRQHYVVLPKPCSATVLSGALREALAKRRATV